MNLVALYDTSVATRNLGDFIIMDAVKRELHNILSAQMVTLPTHDSIGKEGRKILRNSKFAIVGGSNLLSSHYLSYNQWKISPLDLIYLDHAILMGIGWWQYQDKPDLFTRLIQSRVLHSSAIHSVRDENTKNQLLSIGVKNVLNTSCPTMWQLTPEHCSDIRGMKQHSVVFTITDYNQSPVHDRALVKILLSTYEHVYFWPQGSKDSKYLSTLMGNECDKITKLGANLESFDYCLEGGCDYVGTRLHAGIRALQKKCRSYIVGIDNRAREKAKDFNIHVTERDNVESLTTSLNKNYRAEITIPQDNILNWKEQFRFI